MPVRGTVAVLATVVGLVMLFSFKTPDAVPARGNGQALAPGPSPSDTSNPEGGSDEEGAPPAPAVSPTPSSNGSSYKSGSFTGQDVTTRFGDIQVQVVVSGGKITAVKALQLPYDRPRSQEISQYVGPALQDEVVQAQSANIDTISGATYTSDAYAQSVQSALDQAH